MWWAKVVLLLAVVGYKQVMQSLSTSCESVYFHGVMQLLRLFISECTLSDLYFILYLLPHPTHCYIGNQLILKLTLKNYYFNPQLALEHQIVFRHYNKFINMNLLKPNHQITTKYSSLTNTKTKFKSLKQLAASKQQKAINHTIHKLNSLKTFYDSKFISSNTHTRAEVNNAEDQDAKPSKNTDLFQPNFDDMSRRFCENTIFELNVFLSVFGQSHRNKNVLSKLYGYTQELGAIMFPNKRLELKMDFRVQDLHEGLGLNLRNFKTKNDYNKLRLFLVELQSLNKKQQDTESKLIKMRISNKLQLIDREMSQMLKSNHNRTNISKYVLDIQKTHETMINNKLRIHNRRDNVQQFQQTLGKMQLNRFYVKQQRAINDIQQYFTNNRLRRID